MLQADLFTFAIGVLERLQINYMLVGSLAAGTYGEPRLTNDIDLVIDPTTEQIRLLCSAFDPADFYVSVDAALQALRQPAGEFNVIHPESANKIDFMITRRDAWGRAQLSRRQQVQVFPNVLGFAARPEDVIIGKLLYFQEGGSDKHLRDITGMLEVSPDKIDRAYIDRWAVELGVSDIWSDAIKRTTL